MPLRDQFIAARHDFTDDDYMGLNRIMMTEYLRDVGLARCVFARAEMSNNPVQSIHSDAI
ncbi:hypothetical protein [Ruegeria arenilitoris]|uniref:hypothetical protein n=1 Tax=Ruegeria arenilitoris TaxID=1173585 RepID=UPI00147F6FA1|nr:hypothetical protein [Ruegeria arenilitoris]